jgi:hypothetical protein
MQEGGPAGLASRKGMTERLCPTRTTPDMGNPHVGGAFEQDW